MQKPPKPKPGEGGLRPTKGMMENYPALFAYLTDDQYDDGSRRQRASLLIMADGQVWKGWLNDKDTGRSLWLAGETIEQLLDSMETHLTDGTATWRQDTKEFHRRGKNRS